MSDLILVHPNNQLTRVNDLTIPNLERYKNSIIDLLEELKHPSTSKDSKILTRVDSSRLQALIKFKESEKKYIESYIRILTSLESVCKSCQIDGSDNYDYEKEDEILNNVEAEMKVFKNLEHELAENKQLFETDGHIDSTDVVDTSGARRPSIVQLERDISLL